MRQPCISGTRQLLEPLCSPRCIFGLIALLCITTLCVQGQSAGNYSLTKQVEQLTEAMTRAQASLEQSQREIEQMRHQLAELQKQMAEAHIEESASTTTATFATQVEEIRERQEVQESQIATHEQAKVESESKYPVKLTGLILMNGFVNTGRVDDPVNPTMSLPGSGSTGASIRQTILGLDARGPHLLGASSYADIRVDFGGGSLSNSYSGAGQSNDGQLRLRTAHAGLQWERTEAFFSFDHSLVAPNTPTSLTAVTVPALAWSGNLWAWNPQVGLTQDFPLTSARQLRMQVALIDIFDPPPVYNRPSNSTAASVLQPGTAEQSRWPGLETRFSLMGAGRENTGSQIGLGGVFAPHSTFGGTRFDTWAGTLDYRLRLAGRMELTGSFYRGQALGGLGGGGFKDYVYRVDPDNPDKLYFHAVDDIGGWAQLKQRASAHLEFNGAFGMDDVLGGQLRPYAGPPTALYLNLARSRTYTGNVIYSPSAFLLFSFEYRHVESSPINGSTSAGDIFGVATGYRF